MTQMGTKFVFHLSIYVTVSSIITIIQLTEVHSHIFTYCISNGHSGCVTGVGAREAARDPRGPVVIIIHYQPWSLAWLLLVPVNIMKSNVVCPAAQINHLSWAHRQ